MPIYHLQGCIKIHSDDHPLSQQESLRIQSILQHCMVSTMQCHDTLCLQKGVLSLQSPNTPQPLSIDFNQPPYRHTIQDKQRSVLAKACGVGKQPLRILDTTTGLAQDTFQLGVLGCHVTAIDYHPLLYLLLTNAWLRLGKRNQHVSIDWQLRSAIDFLHLAPPKQWDVVMIDPMFTHVKKSLPQKEKQHLRHLLPAPQPAWHAWWSLACQAGKRVIIKQPHKAPALPLPKPTFRVVAKAIRFDVWCQPD